MIVKLTELKNVKLNFNKIILFYGKNEGLKNNAVNAIFNNQDEIFLQKYKSHCATKGMLDASDIVGSVNFLLSDKSNYIKGQNIIIDDGYSI